MTRILYRTWIFLPIQALTYLDCVGNQLTSLDVSANTALTSFNCSGNSITSIDVSANTALTTLNCSVNSI
ncbi:MAG: leucine-rich repeat domain-containing protein [Bacteroidetes bacterium]|nr:leucine-rich repeat domain-containing protein [Bacteroidota bacterium]